MVDTNILIDTLVTTEAWHDWSLDMLLRTTQDGAVVTSVIAVGEMSARGLPLDMLMQALEDFGIAVRSLEADAAYRAGQAQRAYRENGGRRERLLGDFLIGAHASAIGAALLTRDSQRYRTYFPELTLITPETHP